MNQREPDSLLGARLRDKAAGDPSRPAHGDVSQLLFLASQEPTARAPAWPQIEQALQQRREVRSARWLWPALALTSLVIATTATAGPIVWRWLHRDAPAHTTPRSTQLTPTPAPAVVEAPALPKAVTTRPAAKRKPRAIALTPGAPATTVKTSPSLLAQESQLLGEALTALRKHNDPVLALRRLDEYALRFPAGELGKEAQHTRVQSYLMQKQTAPALALLDQMVFSPRARDMEALTVRGELRARAERCADAVQDFAAVLSRTSEPAVAERALFGRASCLLAQRQSSEARATLQEYLRRFPGGAHAAQARNALGQ